MSSIFLRSCIALVLTVWGLQPVMSQESLLATRMRPAGSVVTIEAVATTGDALGLVRYVQDSTAALAIYPGGSSPSSFQQVGPGDRIRVTGVLTLFHGLLEINPVISWTLVSTGNALPDPIDTEVHALTFHDQGKLVRLACLRFDTEEDRFSSGELPFFTRTGEVAEIYLENGNSLVGNSIPQATVTLTGIAGYYDGYRILPRGQSDVSSGTSCLHVLPEPKQSQITQQGFVVSWQSSDPGQGMLIVRNEQSITDTLWDEDAGMTMHTMMLSGLDPAGFYTVQAGVVAEGDTALYPVRFMSTQSTSSGDIAIYFNNDVDASFSSGSAPDGTTFQAMLNSVMHIISAADSSIDVAMYNSNRPDIIFALEEAEHRGVRVRYIGDADQSNSALSPLPDFPVFFRNASGIMHHKFIVADAHDAQRAVVWAGSTNHSTNQLSWDPNNAIVIQDQALAKAYLHEFEEMWGGNQLNPNPQKSRVGAAKIDDTPHVFNIAGREVEAYFSPSDHTNTQILHALQSAEDHVEAALLLLTRSDLTQAMTQLVQGGVDVRVLINDIESSTPQFQNLLSGGVEAEEHDFSSIFHHKYAIIDEGTPHGYVLSGSHNWTTSATTINDENLLIIRDPDIANIYRQEFEARWKEVRPTGVSHALPFTIEIAPNPVSDFLHMRSSPDWQSCSIFSTQGALLLQSSGGRDIDVSALLPGMYFVEVSDSRGARQMVPIVKL